MTSVVLDASALLAYVDGEPGAAMVASLIGDAIISAVNFSEVVAKLVGPDLCNSLLLKTSIIVQPPPILTKTSGPIQWFTLTMVLA